jgi:hypothetical protein
VGVIDISAVIELFLKFRTRQSMFFLAERAEGHLLLQNIVFGGVCL